MSTNEKAKAFAALHVPGDPLILFNVWDAGSAQAVERAGAKAVATGSDSVARAHGHADGEDLPIDFAIANAERIAGAVNVPVTIDFEGGYAAEPERVAENVGRLAATGAVGCNFEDQKVGGQGLYSVEEQTARIRAVRERVGADFFINARTDLFLKAKPDHHDDAMVDEALERVRAYAGAGASGFFVPLLADLKLVERLCAHSPLPVNAMHFPGAPSKAEWAGAGIARISHGPFPHRALMERLEQMAWEALA